MKNLILVKASSNIQDLTGNGLEYLLDANGEVIAIFSEGNFLASNSKPIVSDSAANEITKIVA